MSGMSPTRIALAGSVCLLCLLARPTASAAAKPTAPAAARADTGFVLLRTDSGYADAMALADVLQRAGIRIALVGRSKFAGFLDQGRAASFDTDHGRFAVLFFHDPDGAERVHWDVERRGKAYRYTFHWSEAGRARTYREDFGGPQLFLGSGPWFLITWSDSTYDALKDALTLPSPGIG
jgi:hypothetical protein